MLLQVWQEEEVVGYDRYLGDITEVVTYHQVYDSTEDLELSNMEAMTEGWADTLVKDSIVVAEEYDEATTASLRARYEEFLDEPMAHIFHEGENRYFTDVSGTCYKQEPGQLPKIISSWDF